MWEKFGTNRSGVGVGSGERVGTNVAVGGRGDGNSIRVGTACTSAW